MPAKKPVETHKKMRSFSLEPEVCKHVDEQPEKSRYVNKILKKQIKKVNTP